MNAPGFWFYGLEEEVAATQTVVEAKIKVRFDLSKVEGRFAYELVQDLFHKPINENGVSTWLRELATKLERDTAEAQLVVDV